VGRGGAKLGEPVPPTDFSTTHVAGLKGKSALDIEKTKAKLIRELEGWEELLPNSPWFSARDRVSWVGMRLDVGSLGGNGEAHKSKVRATDSEVDVDVAAASFFEGTNSALVVRVKE
jgi:hypothetical protein